MDYDIWLFPYGSSGIVTIAVSGAGVMINCYTYTDEYGTGDYIRATTIEEGSSQTHQLDATNYTYFNVNEGYGGTAASPINYTVTISGEASSPVSLASLSAKQQGESVVLSRATESETDNLGFILDR